MPTANPLEQLRRRMQQHATPAAFAALAEEHRRAGRFDEAIAVCRDGLARYPTYVSARVTLGRALLDSGDAGTAVAELEQAVAQAPDNLAAARTLEAAQAVLGDAASLAPEPSDLPLHTRDDRECDGQAPPTLGAFVSGPDGPQEFGLGPDWSIPGGPVPDSASSADATGAPPVQDALAGADGAETQAIFAHAEAPTMYFGPQHLQGEEPAGVWPVPSIWDEPVPGGDQNRIAAPGESLELGNAFTSEAPVAETPAASNWLEPESAGADLPVEASSSLVDWAPDVVAEEASAPDAPVVAVEDLEARDALPSVSDEASPRWSGFFDEESEQAPAPADWSDGTPSTPPEPAWGAWSEDAGATQGGGWGETDGPPAAWALDEAPAADAPPFRWDADAGAAADSVAAALGVDAPDAPEPLWREAEVPAAPVVAWDGSVESALDEVFALAGPAESDPAAHESPALSAVMAEAAVDAAREDATGPDEQTPPAALESLQRMLESVRARRAALLDDHWH